MPKQQDLDEQPMNRIGKREAARLARVAIVREAENILGCTMLEWRRLQLAPIPDRRMTIGWAWNALRDHGIELKRDPDEFRINYLGGNEAMAYYTDDLQDAYATGLLMALQRRS
jgi:hypothetical protein